MSADKDKNAYMLQFFDNSMKLGNAAYPAYFKALRKVNSPWNWTIPFLFRRTSEAHKAGLEVVKLVGDLQTKAIDVDLNPDIAHDYKITTLKHAVEIADSFGKFGDEVVQPFIQFIKADNKWLEDNGFDSRRNEFVAIHPSFI